MSQFVVFQESINYNDWASQVNLLDAIYKEDNRCNVNILVLGNFSHEAIRSRGYRVLSVFHFFLGWIFSLRSGFRLPKYIGSNPGFLSRFFLLIPQKKISNFVTSTNKSIVSNVQKWNVLFIDGDFLNINLKEILNALVRVDTRPIIVFAPLGLAPAVSALTELAPARIQWALGLPSPQWIQAELENSYRILATPGQSAMWLRENFSNIIWIAGPYDPLRQLPMVSEFAQEFFAPQNLDCWPCRKANCRFEGQDKFACVSQLSASDLSELWPKWHANGQEELNAIQ